MRPWESLKTMVRFARMGDWEMIAYLAHAKLRRVDLGPASHEQLDIPEGRSHHHLNSGGSHVARVLRTLAISPGDTVLDVGCGKGGALITLSKFPFARVDGLDLSEPAVAIARENLGKVGLTRCTIYQCDAAQFPDYDRYNFLYMFHPFPAAILAEVLQAVRVSLARRPRKLVLIYVNCLSHDTIVAAGFKKISEFVGEWGPTMVFTLDAPAPPSAAA